MEPNPSFSPWLLALILIAFPVVFIGMWSLVLTILSAASGWKKIAARFPGQRTPEGTLHGMVTGLCGWVSYRNCLKVHVSPDGLHIVPWKIFGLGHPPLFIPWEEMHHAKTSILLFRTSVAFAIGEPSVGKMTLPKKLFAGQRLLVDGQPISEEPPPLP